MSKRAKRRFESEKKFKQRLKKWLPFYKTHDKKVNTWKDLKKQEYSKFLKDTPTPCSCEACVGERYDRNIKKNNDKIIMNEQFFSYQEELNLIDHFEVEDYYNDMNEFYMRDS